MSVRSFFLVLLAAATAFIALSFAASTANAAFTLSGWALTPSTTQAGGHPNVNFHLDPDAVAGDQTSDDLKSVKVEFSAGMLGNPEASSSCSDSQFASDTCPALSKLGSLSVQYRKGSSYFTMPGNVYELVRDSNSVLKVGFIARPSGYQKVFLKSTSVGGIATVRTGVDADYGIDVNFDNIPRQLKTTLGALTNITISKVDVNLWARVNNSSSNKYFTFNPTRCGVQPTRVTAVSYLGVSQQKTSSYTTTGCSSVPFTPTFAATYDSAVAGAATGLSATVTVPTADATIQQSHVKTITTTLPTGTGLNFPNIAAVPALCSDAQLAGDACPAGSQIGTTSVNVPFLPPAMTGKIYLMSRGNGITFGYTLHGSGNTLVVLKGSATVVDLDSDTIPDAVRAYLINLPQAPFSSATLDFDAQLINNPVTPCTANGRTTTAAIAGWSGTTVTKTSSGTLTNCVTAPPVVSISAPVNGALLNTTAASVAFTATNSPTAVTCSLDGGAASACTSPQTYSGLAQGSHTVVVSAANAIGSGTAAVTFSVDSVSPVVAISSPANGSVTGSSVTANFTVTDAAATTSTCQLDAGLATACTSPQAYTGLAVGSHTIIVRATDQAGNVGTAITSFTAIVEPDLFITSPTNGAIINTTSVSVAFTPATASPGTTITCRLDAGPQSPCASPHVFTGLSQGAHTAQVCRTNTLGETACATVNFTVDSIVPTVSIASPVNGSSQTSTSTSVVFTANGTGTSLTGTTCQLDAAAATACVSGQAYSGLSVGSHTIVVTATDQAGNVGTASTTFTVTGGTAPTVTITGGPAEGSTINTKTASFTYASNQQVWAPYPCASGQTCIQIVIDVSRYDCQIDGGSYTICSSNGYSNPSYTTPQLNNGSHTFCVTTTNGSGQTSPPACRTFTVNVPQEPVVNITSPSNNLVTVASSINVNYNAVDDSGIAPTCNQPSGAATTLAVGANTVTITCTDNLGNVGTASITVTRVAVPPSSCTVTGSDVSCAWTMPTGTSASVTAQCRLDGSATASCTSPKVYTALAAGNHAFGLCMFDVYGYSCADTPFSIGSGGAAPTVTISSPVSGSYLSTASSLVHFTTTGSPTSVACQVDVDTSVPCTTPFATSGLSQGSHTVTVSATNADGTGTATANFTVDTIAPVVNICSPSGPIVTATYTLCFTVVDASPVTTTCRVDAGAATPCTSPQSYTLPGGSHTFTVTATDAAGNVGSASVSITPPDLPIVTISPSTTCSGLINTTSCTIVFSASSGSTTTCALDGGPAVACTSPKSYTGLAQGSHAFVVTATNAAGSSSATGSFVVDSLPPIITIAEPANGAITNTTVSVAFTANGTGSAIAGTFCRLDAGIQEVCTSPKTYSGLTLGTHTVEVSATDQAANVASAVVTFTTNPPPPVTITSPTNGQYIGSTSVPVIFTAPAATSATCQLDATSAVPCTSGYTFTGLSQGAHSITVCATNTSGTLCSSVNFRVDTIAPVVNICSPTGPIAGTSYSLCFTVSDASPVTVTCRIDGQPPYACTSPIIFSSLSAGSHTIVVSAIDAAGNSGSASLTIIVGSPPVVTINPVGTTCSGLINQTSCTVYFSSPTATSFTCRLDSGGSVPCTSPHTFTGIGQGAHTYTITGSNAYGSGSAGGNFSLDSIAPVVTITSPVNGAVYGGNPPLSYTVSEPSATITCSLDGAPVGACPSNYAYSTGVHTLQICATDAAGNVGCAVATFTVMIEPPVLDITSAPGPATADTTPTYSFTLSDGSTTFTCRMDSAPAVPCTSPYTAPVQSDVAQHTFTVTASSPAGSVSRSSTTLIDSRPFNINATVNKVANSLTSAANVSLPAQHPNVQSTVTLEGAEDVQNATLVLPHGLNGSLAAIPAAARCSLAQAANGTCPASSRIGSGSGQIVVTDSETPLTVMGEGYLTDPPTTADAAGIAMKATVPGGRGDIIATGGVKLTNNGTTQEATATNIPTTTTTGVPFHATSVSVTIEGDIGGAAHPLVTNPSYCGNPSGTIFWAPFNATTNPNGFKGQFVNIVGNVTSYAASSDTVTVPYPITGCGSGVPPYAPTMTHVLSSAVPGTNSALRSTLTVPANNSTTQRVSLLMPPKLGPNLASFGSATDMCSNASLTNITAGTTGVGNRPFNPSSCPAQARVGQAVITTPLLTDPVIADIYLINKIPLPWIGIHVDPTISPQNPQGVTIDLVGTTGLPTVNGLCNSDTLGEPCGGPGTNICDEATQGPCQTRISANFSIMPDVPISTAVINLGRMADGTTPPPGRVGVGGITSNEVMQVAPVGEATCSDGTNPSGTIVSGSGTPEDPYVTVPYTQSALATLTSWSGTTSTGGVIAGGNATSAYELVTPGC